jgi:hypothetical protein
MIASNTAMMPMPRYHGNNLLCTFRSASHSQPTRSIGCCAGENPNELRHARCLALAQPPATSAIAIAIEMKLAAD